MATATMPEMLQLVTFKLGNEEYGIDILKVQEINRMTEITTMPKSAFSVEGVINLRGKVIPVVNLRKRFGLEMKELDSQSRIIVVDAGSTIGLIVDSVSEVIRIPSDTIEPPPPITGGIGSEYVRGIVKLKDRLIILLDIDRLLSDRFSN